MDIRALRKARGWTQAELARRLDTDHVTVSRWERGVATPRRSTQRRLTEVLGLGHRRPERIHPPADDPTKRLRDVDRLVSGLRDMKPRTTLDR